MNSELMMVKQKEFKKNKKKRALLAFALISPYLLIFLLFSFIPFIMGFVMSFMRYNPYDKSKNAFVGFNNYKTLFTSNIIIIKEFWKSFGTMFLFDIITVPCMIVIPLVLAYLINLNPPGYKFFRAIIYLPSIVSITIVGIIFGNMFAGNSSGLINAWFHTDIKWLSGKPFEGDSLRWFVMLLASIWWQTGTNFVIFSGALRDVPKSLYEACEMDGGSRFKLIRFVTLPNIKTSIAICLFNTLIGYLNLYGQPVVLNEIENENIAFSPMMFIQKWLSNTSYASKTGFVCACAVIFGLIVLVFSLIERKVMSRTKHSKNKITEYKEYMESKEIYNSLATLATKEVI